jgi:DNA topoisomerase-1
MIARAMRAEQRTANSSIWIRNRKESATNNVSSESSVWPFRQRGPMVWICPSPIGHIQATGRDARRRKQYRYHERWRELRDENKFGRLAAFAKALPNIRRRAAKDLKMHGLPREKVLAAIVRLLDRTFIRIGNEEYARENKSFGLTTMQDRHVTVKGARLRFSFRGKSGRQHKVDITDRRIAKIVSKCQDLPRQDLFQYISDDDEVRNVTSQDVNDYLREITGEDFTAKDFRTWGGTVLAGIALSAQEKFETQKQAKANIKSAICAVAQLLGNTPAICRKCYVHPAVIEAYINRSRIAGTGEGNKRTQKCRSARSRGGNSETSSRLKAPTKRRFEIVVAPAGGRICAARSTQSSGFTSRSS